MYQKDLHQSCTEIKASDNKVYVTWWDKGPDGSDTPLIRISQDNGQTFGDTIMLTANSTATNTMNSISSPA